MIALIAVTAKPCWVSAGLVLWLLRGGNGRSRVTRVRGQMGCGNIGGKLCSSARVRRSATLRVARECWCRRSGTRAAGSQSRRIARRCSCATAFPGDRRRPRARGRRSASVHPYACGENVGGEKPLERAAGSPPCVWGKLDAVASYERLGRFTPTRVGKTSPPPGSIASPTVHPHACGENGPTWICSASTAGSPPRVWGKRLVDAWNAFVRRFTPTRVGKTLLVPGIVLGQAVHPHACGENRSADGRRSRRSVHPHACGENRGGREGRRRRTGSPPRVWGKRSDAPDRCLATGSPPRVWGKLV